MAFGPITSWQKKKKRWGGKVETVTDFLFLGSKITADDDCSHEIKRHLLLGRKAVINLLLLLPQSLGFSRQEHWSGLPFPSPMRESEK